MTAENGRNRVANRKRRPALDDRPTDWDPDLGLGRTGGRHDVVDRCAPSPVHARAPDEMKARDRDVWATRNMTADFDVRTDSTATDTL